MKKIILSLIGFSFISASIAQEAFDKKMQFGIALGTGFNMNKTSSLVERKGVGFDQTLGLNLNYNLNSTVTLTTGVEFDFESFKYTPRGTDTLLYYYTDNNIISKEKLDTVNTAKSHNLFSLTERQYKANYFTIPVFLTLKTKPFGNLQYFGKFGARFAMKVGGRINDEGYNFKGDSITGGYESSLRSNSNMVLQNDIRFFKINAGVAGGAMWNFSGTTMLVAEIGYYFGLTQIHADEKLTGSDKKRDYTLIDLAGDRTFAEKVYSQPAAKQGQILIKFTLFF